MKMHIFFIETKEDDCATSRQKESPREDFLDKKNMV